MQATLNLVTSICSNTLSITLKVQVLKKGKPGRDRILYAKLKMPGFGHKQWGINRRVKQIQEFSNIASLLTFSSFLSEYLMDLEEKNL